MPLYAPASTQESLTNTMMTKIIPLNIRKGDI